MLKGRWSSREFKLLETTSPFTSHVVLITSNFFFSLSSLKLIPLSTLLPPTFSTHRAPLAMAKATKATIKFQKKHLKTAIEQRRKKQKATQLYKKRNPNKFGANKAGGASTGRGAEESDGEGREDDGEDDDSNEKEGGKE